MSDDLNLPFVQGGKGARSYIYTNQGVFVADTTHPEIAAHIVIAVNSHEVLVALLARYRNETPLGHQPHMIAHEVDAALLAAGEKP